MLPSVKLTDLLPEIPEAEQTPLVKQLVAIIEQLAERVAQLEERVAELRDEVAVLKGLKPRPKIQPSRLEEPPDNPVGGTGTAPQDPPKRSRRPGKTAELVIHEEQVIQPERLPEGARFLGYDDYVVQDIRIELHNIRFRLGRWLTAPGTYLKGSLPEEVQGYHFGPHLRSYVLYQYYHQHVTQPLLLEQLRAFGIDISSGELSRLLTAGHEGFHAETDALLRAGMEVSTYLNVDDTSARHQGKNGYCLYLGSQYFAWYQSGLTKDRLNFITVLWSASPCPDYRVDAVAVEYLHARGASQWLIERFTYQAAAVLADEAAWEAYLKARVIVEADEVRWVTEAARLASLVAQGWLQETVILSDGAGQFAILYHALCWIHAERALRRLVPPGPVQRQAQERVLDEVWKYYRALKAYQQSPQAEQAARLSAQFDALCLQTTGYHALDKALKRLHQNKADLLRVLERPDIPLHNNAAEEGLRDVVKKRKVSAGTHSESGRTCRDHFASLKKTCLKLKVPFLEYLRDRVFKRSAIPSLADLIRMHAAAHAT
jgi:Transposase IS66 family